MISIKPIGRIQSPFREKFGTPRQANIVPAIEMQLRLLPPYDQADAVRGLEDFSHIWLLFWFDQVPEADSFQPLVRPPRLGGNDKVGVFASRSPFRPNPMGLSLVELEKITFDDGVILHLRGGDLVDGTPVLDIKPYIPYADSAENPRAGFAVHAPAKLSVEWSNTALQSLQKWCDVKQQSLTHWREMIEQTLAQDPRPAYHDEPGRIYGVTLGVPLEVSGRQLNIRFAICQDSVSVVEIESI